MVEGEVLRHRLLHGTRIIKPNASTNDDVDGYLDDSDTTFTPLRSGKENESPKGNDDEEEVLMGEVAVDENGNEYGP